MSKPTIIVSAEALETLLRAVMGPPHHVRELQFTRGLPGFDNCIDVLQREFNAAIAAPVVERQPACYVVKDRWGVNAYLEESSEALKIRRRLGFTDEVPLYTDPPELAELQAIVARLTAENADMQTRLAEACEFIDNPYDKEKLQALIAECRYGVSGKGPAIEVANDLLNDCCDNLESLLKDNERLKTACSKEFASVEQLTAELERLKGGQGEAVAEVVATGGPHDREDRVLIELQAELPPVGTKLYTSQPAPVSVVLPESQWGGPYQDGWNACLDKVKELNQ